MDSNERIVALADAVAGGQRRRIVGPGGAGKTHLLDQLPDRLADRPIVRWNPAIEARPEATSGVLVVDDAHLATADQLRTLLRWPSGVVVAHRPASPDAEQVLDALDGAPLVLEPLDATAVAALLAARWRVAPDPDVVDRFHRATGGMPRLIASVAGEAPADDARPTATLHELLRAERHRLGAAERTLLDAAAVLEGLDLSLLAAAANLQVNAAANAAERLTGAGLAVTAGSGLAPVIAAAVRELVPASSVATFVERAAAVAVRLDHELLPLAEHIRAAGVTGAAPAACLLAAARQILDEDPARAHALISAAARGGAPAGDLAAMQALTGFRRGDVRATVTAVDELLRSDAGWRDAPLRREAVEAGAVMLARRGAWERCAALADAVGDTAVAPAAIAHLAMGDAAGLRATVAAAGERATPDLRAAAGVSLARGLEASLDADPTAALPAVLDATRLYELAAPDVELPVAGHALAAIVACNLWEFDVAAQVLTAPAADATAFDRLLRAWIALRRGDWVAAAATVEQVRAHGPLDARDAVVACAVEAGTARRRGDLAAMDRAWREARTLLLRLAPDLLIAQPVTELLITGARLGDHGTVRTGVAAVHRILARADHPPLWTLPVLWDELHIGLAADDAHAARSAARTADALAAPGSRGAVMAAAGRCWVDAVAGTADVGRVREAAGRLADIGLAWEAARLAGAAAIRMADGAGMRELLELARGLRTERAPRLTSADGALSPRERDVATHLLAGLTYREIGGQLYIAPKTVEHHVARIRRKLGVKTRAELLVALRRHAAIA